jgi:hypothetical protein
LSISVMRLPALLDIDTQLIPFTPVSSIFRLVHTLLQSPRPTLVSPVTDFLKAIAPHATSGVIGLSCLGIMQGSY